MDLQPMDIDLTGFDEPLLEEVLTEGVQQDHHSVISGTMFTMLGNGCAVVCVDYNTHAMENVHPGQQNKIFELTKSSLVASNACTCLTTPFMTDVRLKMNAATQYDLELQTKLVLHNVERKSIVMAQNNPDLVNLIIKLDEPGCEVLVCNKDGAFVLRRFEPVFFGPGVDFLHDTDLLSFQSHNFDTPLLLSNIYEAYSAMSESPLYKNQTNDTLQCGFFRDDGLAWVVERGLK